MKHQIQKQIGLCAAIAGLLTAATATASTLTLNFDSTGGTILDSAGQGTGFGARLAGTGGALPANDPNLLLNTGAGTLALTSQQADYNGQGGMAIHSAPGINLSTLGFTGTQDFSVTAVFNGPMMSEFIDQVGIYVGKNSATLTRSGFITFGAQEYFSGHTQGGLDNSGRFFGFGLNVADGMTVTISRVGGFWDYIIDGVHWLPNTVGDGTGAYVPAAFLDPETDLTVGIFAITPLNANPKTYFVDSFTAVVPEPSSFALLGVGGLACAWLRRRRSNV